MRDHLEDAVMLDETGRTVTVQSQIDRLRHKILLLERENQILRMTVDTSSVTAVVKDIETLRQSLRSAIVLLMTLLARMCNCSPEVLLSAMMRGDDGDDGQKGD